MSVLSIHVFQQDEKQLYPNKFLLIFKPEIEHWFPQKSSQFFTP